MAIAMAQDRPDPTFIARCHVWMLCSEVVSAGDHSRDLYSRLNNE